MFKIILISVMLAFSAGMAHAAEPSKGKPGNAASSKAKRVKKMDKRQSDHHKLALACEKKANAAAGDQTERKKQLAACRKA